MPSTSPAGRSIGLIVGLTIAVLIASGAMLAINHSNSAARQQRLVIGNYETMSLMRETVIALQGAELGQQHYLLTGDPAALEPYEQARLHIEAGLRQLEAAASVDPEAARLAREFRGPATEKLERLGDTVAAYRLYGRDAALALSRTGAPGASMEQIRRAGDMFIEGQRLVLAQRLATLRSEQAKSDIAGLLVMGGAFLCLIAGMAVVIAGTGRLQRAQRELLARSNLLMTTLESLRDPIFVIDADGTVAAWNEPFVQLAGWNPAKHGALTRDQLLSDRSPSMHALLGPLKLDGEGPERPVVARGSYDGRDYEVSRGDMSDGGVVVRCIDITEKLRDEAALHQGQKMEAIGHLTGGMAHDFNNILQVVQANLELVRADVSANPEMLVRLRSAMAAAERGARLTHQLLAFARRQPLVPQPTSVARLLSDLTDLLRHSLGERVIMELTVAEDAWNARIDPGQLENAILNLAINARDAMADGGTVSVEVSNVTLDQRYASLHSEVTPGPYVLVAVSDTGTGMPPDVAAQAFDPFFTTKRDGKGTGLGLSMVYGFVRQSSGHIRIDSAIGQGTSVKLYLPRTLDAVAERQADATTTPTGRERILVVEDHDDVRLAVVDTLKGWGYRVTPAEGADAAVALLNGGAAFDLLFTDVVMPGATPVMEMVRLAQRLQPDITVLLTSGYARDLVPEHGDRDYPMIAKPYGGAALAAKVRSVLATRRPPAPEPEAARPQAAPVVGAPRRVLLVEDEVLLRMSVADMLERLGCSVEGVGSAEQALEVLALDESFDLLLTDLGLPGMSGEELAAEVGQRYGKLPVVIASGYSRPEGQLDGRQFITKPYSSVDLQQVLDHAARTAV
jgi:signal transduction histidine kinase/DNA-binding response OmpR family regulator